MSRHRAPALVLALLCVLAPLTSVAATAPASAASASRADFPAMQLGDTGWRVRAFQHIGILSLEFHVDKLSRPLL